MDDLPLANREAPKVLARDDRARDQDEKIARERMACADPVNRHVLPFVAGVADRTRDVARIGRDVRRHAEVRRLVDVPVEDHDTHGPESMPPWR